MNPIPVLSMAVLVLMAAIWAYAPADTHAYQGRSAPPTSSQKGFAASEKIVDLLSSHLQHASNIQALVMKDVREQRENLRHFDGLSLYLLEHKAALNAVDYLYFATPEGGITTAGINPEGILQIMKTPANAPGDFIAYRVDAQGKLSDILKNAGHFDPRERGWYQCASNRYSGCWSPPYTGKLDNILGVSFASAVYDPKGEFLGILGLDLLLAEISRELKDTRDRLGQVSWVLDHQGGLIASSNGIDEVISRSGANERTRLAEIRSDLGPRVAQLLTDKHIILAAISRPQQHRFSFRNSTYLLTLEPFRPNMDINWVIATTIPL